MNKVPDQHQETATNHSMTEMVTAVWFRAHFSRQIKLVFQQGSQLSHYCYCQNIIFFSCEGQLMHTFPPLDQQSRVLV